jgi:hypothetical protein
MTVTPTSLTTLIQAINTTWKVDPATIGCTPVLTGSSYLCDLTNGNSFTNTGREFIYVIGGASTTDLIVTVNDQTKCDHGFDHDVVANIPASTGRMLGPFPVGWFTSTALVTYSGSATGTPHICVFRLPLTSPIPE